MGATWIVSANAGRARFFSQANAADRLEEVNDMVNDVVRLRTLATESDKIGPTSATKSQHNVGAPTPNKAYEPHQTPDEHQTELFARDVNGFLLQGYRDNCFEQIVLVASPQFLGELRRQLDPNLKPLVKLEINKDYTQSGIEQLRDQLQAHSAK